MDTAHVKQLNLTALRALLVFKRAATIQELSKLTGLSVVTVKALLGEMIECGEVTEGDMVPSGGGRPSRLYVYNGDYRHAVLIYGHQEQNRNSIHLLVINLFEEIVYSEQAYIDDIQIDSFCGMIDRAVKTFQTIAAIAFGLPGFEENGKIVANDYSGIVGNGFLPFYQSRYGFPVAFINDVNAAVKGYSLLVPAKTCLVGIYFPRIYRPGAGMVINGKVYLGTQNFAGEIGRLLPDTDWLTLDYNDGEAVADAVSRLLAVYCQVVAPEQFVLYGDFFEENSAEVITTNTEDRLDGQFRVNVSVSAAFDADFERGMGAVALKTLHDTLIR